MRSRLVRRRADQDEPAAGVALDDDTRSDRAIACAACKHPITRGSARVQRDGRHHHTCVNPAGYVFHIACFADAAGATAHGTPTEAHSWFAGYRWRYASCGACSQHLGWHFENGAPFWGLIRAHLVEL